MTRVASRHRLYYDLLDAFRQEGCPLCRLGKLTVARYLDILAYENVNDPGVRDKLRAARGFCNYHAYQFLEEVRDLLGVGIIYRDVANAVVLALPTSSNGVLPRPVLSILRTGSEEASEDPGLATLLRPTGVCPTCKALDEGVSDRLHAFLEHLPEPDFRAAYEDSSGLCYPHFLEALEQVREGKQLELLVATQEAFLARGAQDNTGAEGARAGAAKGQAIGQPKRFGLVGCCFGERGAVASRRQWSRVPTGSALDAAPTPRGGARTRMDLDTCPACEATRPLLAQTVEEFGRELLAGDDGGTELLDLLCNRHAWQLAQAVPTGELRPVFAAVAERRRSRLTAVVQPLLAQENGHGGLELPGRLPRARRLGIELARQLGPQGPCPLCERQAELELAAVQEYAVKLAEAEAASAPTGEVATLCLPHLGQSCHLRLSPSLRTALVRRQALGWSRLVGELKEYIRKQDYRFRDEPRGHEQTSPYRAVAQMAGQKGLR